ncbi:transmembrane protease serine 11D-like [Macrosteles quadrilineatus]|uniref:transmembrane protease serine 11D-like n=1 Tax=Macrosteles quadrilineatus TaxID=74068 RepID=UPI0023E1CD95|nr:transmembrane protease serine 11D-like [Macrosteles quadrilineatus]
MACRILILLFVLDVVPQLMFGMPQPFSELRIINGSNATEGEFPFMAAIFYKGYFTCGGTILSEDWILTAAHCVNDRDLTQFSVLTGTIDLDGDDGRLTYVSQIIVHKGYQDSDNQVNDIALFRLSVALEYDSVTQPVTLSAQNTDPSANSKVVVTGWGVSKINGNPVRYLQKATIQIISNPDCSAPYKPYNISILSTNVCAGTANGGIGQCTGDSGGPVLVEGSNTYQVGIISFSAKPCGIKGYPGVNTRVSQYLGWIQGQSGL